MANRPLQFLVVIADAPFSLLTRLVKATSGGRTSGVTLTGAMKALNFLLSSNQRSAGIFLLQRPIYLSSWMFGVNPPASIQRRR